MSDVRNNIIMIMERFDYTRNFTNLDFYKFYECAIHSTVRLDDAQTDPESVRRCKQLLVEKYPDRYGPNDPVLLQKKRDKQFKTKKMVVMNG